MRLRGLTLKTAYDSDEDDILNEFYVPALSVSIRYKRLAGFFCSTSLAVAARGMQKFVEKVGVMELVASSKLSKADVDAIRDGMQKPDQIIEHTFAEDFTTLEKGFCRESC